MKTLLQMGISPNSKDVNNRTPLHMAAAGGLVEVSRLLLEAEADVNLQDNECATPAYRASQRGQSRTFQLLYEAKADLTVLVNYPWGSVSSAWVAAANAHSHIIEYIWEKASGDARQTVKHPDVLAVAEKRSHASAEYIKSCEKE